MKNLLFLILLLFFSAPIEAQSIINQALKGEGPIDTFHTPNISGCGHYTLMENKNMNIPNYIDLMNGKMMEINQTLKQQNSLRTLDQNEIAKIKVVFHVVYNNQEENIPDSVLYNQIQILNESFRRTNADTVDTRPVFLDIVGDSKIEFVLADKDPFGNPTNGIVRKSTNVEYFGGVLPYSQGQNQQISDWINDSLYYNFFRLTKDSLGGSNAWDTDSYLNIWIGDLRVFEPAFSNFEELIYFGLATPPNENLIQWPDSVMQTIEDYSQGVIMHYPIIGSNNSVQLPSPYNSFNSRVKSGKVLVHEVGHYLGLRHIWGDGDCSFDDFIDDTPNSESDSQWGCNQNRNSCTDNINGDDLPDMVENYMDYSSGSCQNSFTKGQIELMRHIIGEYRPGVLNTSSQQKQSEFSIYPNPTNNKIFIEPLNHTTSPLKVSVYNPQGQLILNQEFSGDNQIELDLKYDPGIYFVIIKSENNTSNFKVIKH